jgi:hypothetical protein
MFLHSVVNKTAFEQAGISDKAVENLTNVLVKCGVLVRRRDKGGELALAKKLPAKQLTNLPTPADISPKAMEDVAWARRVKMEAALASAEDLCAGAVGKIEGILGQSDEN